jgi:catechol 2,3-dioxygenase-like lactoylglutathione lyase family enzyme
MTQAPLLNQINLVARDLDATLAFYRRLGLEVPEPYRTASGAHHAEVSLPNGLTLEFDSPALAQHYNAGWRAPRGGSHGVLGFALASRPAVDETYARMTAAGYRGAQPPHHAFWGARYAVLEDPDGVHVGLMSPSDPARRSAPPAL